MNEQELYQTKVVLYRCTCKHCDAAEGRLRELSERYGAVFEVQRVDRDERLRGFAGWSTPIVTVDGVGITHYKVDTHKWEEAIKERARERPASLAGIVVDMCCYFRHGARPQGHEACAKECFEAGGPIGLAVLDGRVFLALPDRRNPAIFASLKERPGELLRVSGEVRLRDGLAGILVTRVEDAQ